MAKTFRPYQPEQTFLLPPSPRDWLKEDHLALFVSDVVDSLDLRAITSIYGGGDGRGQPPYEPRMMVKLLVYGYCTGKISSRKLEKATWDEVPFRVLSANQHPDHDSIAAFRKRHLKALGDLFVQILKLCREAGLVKLGNVAIDGTKIKANASRHKAMSYARMQVTERQLREQVVDLLAQAQRADSEDDGRHGNKRGDELPNELARRESRLKRIQEAKAALEAEAKVRAAAERQEIEQHRRAREERGGRRCGPEPKEPSEEPNPKAQRNFTDPDSRIMLDGATKSFVQSYNVQAAVDEHAQIIVATDVVQTSPDREQLVPIVERLRATIGAPQRVLADAGYHSTAALTADVCNGIDLYVPPGTVRHDAKTAPAHRRENELAAAMRKKIDSPQGNAIYRRRKAIVEPVFGQVKHVRGFRAFSLRGHAAVRNEWNLVAATHNLLKLFRARNSG